MNSEEFVESVLAKRFELKQAGLSDNVACEFIAMAAKELTTEGVKIVSLVGGAASGKTTLAYSLIRVLAQSSITADAISTDDYILGDRAWRWQHFEGKETRDPIGKYDFNYMNQQITAIKHNTDKSKTIPVPTYNQATGLAIDAGEGNYTHKVGKLDVLLIEGDFHPVENPDLVIFIHLTDQHRLQNRVNRDLVYRSEVDRDKVINNFNLRHQNQHIPHTLPTMKNADIVLRVQPKGKVWKYDVYQAI